MEALGFLGRLGSEHGIFGSSEFFINLLTFFMRIRWHKSVFRLSWVSWRIHFINFALIYPALSIKNTVIFFNLEEGVVEHG